MIKKNLFLVGSVCHSFVVVSTFKIMPPCGFELRTSVSEALLLLHTANTYLTLIVTNSATKQTKLFGGASCGGMQICSYLTPVLKTVLICDILPW